MAFNITVQSLLNTAVYDTYSVTSSTTVGTLKSSIQSATSVDPTWYSLWYNGTMLSNTSATLGSYGITSTVAVRSANQIARLPTLEDRQLAKLDLAALDRSASSNPRSTYDITELPTQYVGNVIVDNPNPSSGSWYWDSVYLGPDLTLSNNDITVTAATTGTGNEPTVLGTYAITASDKVMFSINCDQIIVGDVSAIGIANYSHPLTDWLGIATDSIGFYEDNNYYINGSSSPWGGTFNTSDIVDIAVDRDNDLIWIRVNGGDWNGNVDADPATASIGFDISSITGTVHPAANPFYSYTFGVPPLTQGAFSIRSEATYSTPIGFTFAHSGVRLIEGRPWLATPP
jgi:hypothetical protein